jgi:hypothetical protein
MDHGRTFEVSGRRPGAHVLVMHSSLLSVVALA